MRVNHCWIIWVSGFFWFLLLLLRSFWLWICLRCVARMIQYVFLHQAGYLLSQRSILLALLRSVSDLLFVTAHWRMEVYVVWLFALPKLWLRIRAQPKAAHMMQCLTYLWWPLPMHAPGARIFYPPSFRRGIISAALKEGRCGGPGSRIFFDIEVPENLQRRVCEEVFQNVHELLDHVVTHVSLQPPAAPS